MYLGNVVITAFSFLLLQFDGNAANRRPLDTFHEMGDETKHKIIKCVENLVVET